MASSDNIYIMMRDYLTISTEHQRLMRESEQNMARFHNRLSDVLIEYLRQIPISSYNRHRDASIFSRQTERNTERTRSYSRERQQVPVVQTRTNQPTNNAGVGYNNYRTRPFASAPVSTTTSLPTRTDLENVAPPPIPPPAPPPAPSVESILPPPPPPVISSSPPSPSAPPASPQTPISSNEREPNSDSSAHNNLNEQMLPSQVLIHSPPTRTRHRRIFTRTPFYSNRITNTGVQARSTTFISSFDSPVRIRPSRHQIAQSTSILTYSDISGENIQERCPIDLIDFSANDSVIRIIHCGHIFREMNIRQHFRNSPRCPICRFDIRDHDSMFNNLFGSNSTNTTISELGDLSGNDLNFSYRYIPPERN
jgi:hypothetical protein